MGTKWAHFRNRFFFVFFIQGLKEIQTALILTQTRTAIHRQFNTDTTYNWPKTDTSYHACKISQLNEGSVQIHSL
jgi:hypothetical protein